MEWIAEPNCQWCGHDVRRREVCQFCGKSRREAYLTLARVYGADTIELMRRSQPPIVIRDGATTAAHYARLAQTVPEG